MAPEIRPKSFRAFEKWATVPSKGLFSDDKEGKERAWVRSCENNQVTPKERQIPN